MGDLGGGGLHIRYSQKNLQHKATNLTSTSPKQTNKQTLVEDIFDMCLPNLKVTHIHLW